MTNVCAAPSELNKLLHFLNGDFAILRLDPFLLAPRAIRAR